MHPEVPLSAELVQADVVPFARTLAEADLLKPEHWKGSVPESIDRALTGTGGLSLANLWLCYTDDFEAGGQYGIRIDASDWKARHGLDQEDQVGAIHVHCQPAWYAVGSTLTELEEAREGLGQTLLSVLGQAGAKSLGLIGPPDLWDWVCHLYWGGESDDALAHEEWVTDGGDKEEFFSRADLVAAIPEWALKPKPLPDFINFRERVRLKQGTLFELFSIENIIETAQELAELSRAFDGANALRFLEYPSHLSSPFVLSWTGREGDPTGRILDDAHQWESEGGEIIGDHAFVWLFQWGDENAMCQAWREWARVLAIARKMEALIHLIGHPL